MARIRGNAAKIEFFGKYYRFQPNNKQIVLVVPEMEAKRK